MATAKKLPSGSWRVQVYSHTDENGKKVRKSFTCDDPSPKGKRICEAEAAAWAKEKEEKSASKYQMTFGQAAEEYIALRENVLSPRTVDDYRRYANRVLACLANKNINHITQTDVQSIVNDYAKTHSPKTTQNIHGFISVVLKEYRPDFVLRTKLPKKTQTELYIPSDDDIKKLMEVAKGRPLELPILLAAFGPMRRGEICALNSKDIDGNTVHVCENMVKKIVDGKNTWIIKSPKSYAGDRYIEYPDFVAEKWKGIDGLICQSNPDTITKSFGELLDKAGLPHFRFHDLRHYSASIQHAIGVPDQYIMARGGWGDTKTLQRVYRHALDDRTKSETAKINSYFSSLNQNSSHESSHE